MTSTNTTESALSTDPLETLGSSLFLTILSNLPYLTLATIPSVCKSWRYHSRCNRTGIWLAACRRTGVDPALIIKLLAVDQMSDRTREIPSGPLEEEYTDWNPYYNYLKSDPDPGAGRIPGEVDWKRVCEMHVMEDKNWRFGRCRERWIYPDDDRLTTWRFKIDEVEDTCIITSHSGEGLKVVDASTSESLCDMPLVRDYAHVEFCKGFVVFDVQSVDLSLQVYRTRQAISESTHPWPSSRKLPPEALSVSYVDTDWRPMDCIRPKSGPAPTTAPPLPRGALAYYRTITPPKPCHAFRARVDAEGTDNARAMLGTAGEEAVYIWDLDDEEAAAEVIPIPEASGEIGVKYLEFDDNYIFLCGTTQLHIFSRQTKQPVLAFPPLPTTVPQVCAAVYRVEFANRTEPQELPRPGNVDEGVDQTTFVGRSAVVGRSEVVGHRSDQEAGVEAICMDTFFDPRFSENTDNEEEYPWPPADYDFSACHFNSTDLVYSSLLGHLLITRNYASILAIPDAAERSKQWSQHTIIIAARLRVQSLAVDGSHITANADGHVFFLDTQTLPSLPLIDTTPLPPIRIHTVFSAHNAGVSNSSCCQINGSTIYYTYNTMMDSSDHRPLFGSRLDLAKVPSRSTKGFRRCIRGWNFSNY